MRTLEFQYLPNNTYFWRKGYRWQFLKGTDISIFYMDPESSNMHNHQITHTEIILLSPTFCGSCFNELHNWPPEVKCPYCGNPDEDRADFTHLKKLVGEWTGFPDPHI